MTLRLNLRRTLSVGALLLAACGDESTADNAGSGASDLEVAMSALENPIISCQIQAGECVQKASDLAALQACQSGIGECLKAASDRVQKVADGVGACREQERKCARTKGAQPASCVSDFDKCVQALVPAPTPGFPGLPDRDGGVPSFPGSGDGGLPSFPTLPHDDGGLSLPTPPSFPLPEAGLPNFPPTFPGLGDGGRPGLPSFPGLPGRGDGGLSGLPPLGGGLPQLPGNECLDGLHACAENPGADLFDCAGEARKCLRSAATPFQLP